MNHNLSFIQPILKPWRTLTIFTVVSVLVFACNSLMITTVHGQVVTNSDAWKQVYQQLPDLPKENQYISKETGKVAENNTLVSRMISYHVYRKNRPVNFRLDWKLTIADYLGANEIIYDFSYPGNDTLNKNPLSGDRAAIKRLTRKQRNALVQALVNAFNPSQ